MATLPGAEGLSVEVAAQLAAAAARSSPDAVRSRHRLADGRPRYTNRLILQASPYLRQHAHNPVDWHPWGDEAFAEAQRRGRAVFLSIGYSTCHWCHVMEEESFEDEEIASFLNRNFVAIKVDREERPDVDALYMRAAQTLTGAGGWPLSVWLTPDRQPFYAGTYFPPRAGVRGVGTGFIDLLSGIARLYQDDPQHVAEAARSLTQVVRSETVGAPARGPVRPDPRWMTRVAQICRDTFDERYAGLRSRQKFPSHVPVRLLLRQAGRAHDEGALDLAVRTLDAMASGGIYDHVAGGFHRYATDPAWRIPHFEKMLYDNALLVVAYAEAWQVTKRPRFARVAAETCDELLATFASPGGGFYSATDADSEGEEGKYFVWTAAEIRALLGAGDEAERFLRYYGVDREDGEHVLAEVEPDEDTARALAPARARLHEARRGRVPPLRDEKILAAWNGLAVSAFATAGRVFREPRFTHAARRAAEYVLTDMRASADGHLVRSRCAGQAGGAAFLDDYAFVAAGLLDLFEATQEARWLVEAIRLAEIVERDFADRVHGGWHLTSDAHQGLLARERSLFDGAEPAGGSVALMNVARLAAYTDEARWREVADRALAGLAPLFEQQPMAATQALLAVDFLAGPVREVVLATPDWGLPERWAAVLCQTFCPRKLLVVGNPDGSEWHKLAALVPLVRDKVVRDGAPTAYVCTHGRCELPTNDPDELAQSMSD